MSAITFVHAVRDRGLGNTSYVVEAGPGAAVSVDPPRNVESHLELASRLGLRIVASLETHLHADFVSGSRELQDTVGSEVVAPRAASLDFRSRGVEDGSTIELGNVRVGVLSTPGHTPEHVAYVVECERGSAVFTGGSLIGGGVARTDLIAPERTEELARAQFHSLRRLAVLPAATAVYPTHGAGSFCSAGTGPADLGTIGDQLRSHPLLAIEDEDEFVRTLLDGYGSFPPYFLRLRDVNRRGAVLRGELETPLPLAAHDVRERVARGAWLVDARPIHDWATAHPEGAVSIELRPAFASWLGWVVPFGAEVVLLIEPEGFGEALEQARLIGYDRVAGYLAGGVAAWREAGLPVSSVEEVDAHEAHRRQGEGVALLDVRQRSELVASRIPGTVHLELGSIVSGCRPDAREVVAFCGHGERSATAASLLERTGIRVANFVGGFGAWESAGYPVER